MCMLIGLCFGCVLEQTLLRVRDKLRKGVVVTLKCGGWWSGRYSRYAEPRVLCGSGWQTGQGGPTSEKLDKSAETICTLPTCSSLTRKRVQVMYRVNQFARLGKRRSRVLRFKF